MHTRAVPSARRPEQGPRRPRHTREAPAWRPAPGRAAPPARCFPSPWPQVPRKGTPSCVICRRFLHPARCLHRGGSGHPALTPSPARSPAVLRPFSAGGLSPDTSGLAPRGPPPAEAPPPVSRPPVRGSCSAQGQPSCGGTARVTDGGLAASFSGGPRSGFLSSTSSAQRMFIDCPVSTWDTPGQNSQTPCMEFIPSGGLRLTLYAHLCACPAAFCLRLPLLTSPPELKNWKTPYQRHLSGAPPTSVRGTPRHLSPSSTRDSVPSKGPGCQESRGGERQPKDGGCDISPSPRAEGGRGVSSRSTEPFPPEVGAGSCGAGVGGRWSCCLSPAWLSLCLPDPSQRGSASKRGSQPGTPCPRAPSPKLKTVAVLGW